MRFPRCLVTILLFLSFVPACQNQSSVNSNPNVILWAWERPENLEFIDPAKFGVAFIAQTLNLTGDKVEYVPRRQPLKLAPDTYLIAVTRIETKNPQLSEQQKSEIISFIKKSLELPKVKAIQIDFDATVSEREFYRRLLLDLRSQLSSDVPLTMTALGSWCVGDTWIKNLPVEEAIPMAFDMGADNKTIRNFLASGEDWNEPLCQKSYGISLNEPLNVIFKPNRKFFIFNSNPKGWQKSDLEHLPEGVRP